MIYFLIKILKETVETLGNQLEDSKAESKYMVNFFKLVPRGLLRKCYIGILDD